MVKNAQYGTWLNESHTQFHQATSIAIECGKVLSLSGTHTQIITLEMEYNMKEEKREDIQRSKSWQSTNECANATNANQKVMLLQGDDCKQGYHNFLTQYSSNFRFL